MRSEATLTPVIFDMDGVLVDSDSIFEAAFVAYVAAIDRPEMAGWYPNTVGRRPIDFAGELAPLLERPLDDVMDGMHKHFRALLDSPLAAMPCVPAAVRRVADGRRRVGLASSSQRSFVDRVLLGLRLSTVFAAIASGDEVNRGKPDPQLYLLAAQRLGVEPASAVAIEDSVAGASSAKAAGLTVVGVPSRHSSAEGLAKVADVTVSDLDDAAEYVATLDLIRTS